MDVCGIATGVRHDVSAISTVVAVVGMATERERAGRRVVGGVSHGRLWGDSPCLDVA